MIVSLLLLLPALLPFGMVEKQQILAQLACSEAGWSQKEAARVLRVVKNRAELRGSSVMLEATRPYQFNYKICTGRKAKWLRSFHYSLALSALMGDIKARESVLNNKLVTHYATQKRLKANLASSVLTSDQDPKTLTNQAIARLDNLPMFSREFVNKQGAYMQFVCKEAPKVST